MNRKYAMFGAVALALTAAACTADEQPTDETTVVTETETPTPDATVTTVEENEDA